MKNNHHINIADIAEKEKQKSINQLRKSAFLVAGFVFIGFLGLGLFLYQSIKNYSQSVYVLGYGGSYTAVASSQGDLMDFEVENFIKSFLQTMYSHDAVTFKERVQKALSYISKREGNLIIDDFNRSKLHEQYVQSGGATRLEVDSVFIENKEQGLYECLVFSRQIIYNGSKENIQPIGFKLQVARIPRSFQNPYGLFIEKLRFIEIDLPVVSEPKQNKQKQGTETVAQEKEKKQIDSIAQTKETK